MLALLSNKPRSLFLAAIFWIVVDFHWAVTLSGNLVYFDLKINLTAVFQVKTLQQEMNETAQYFRINNLYFPARSHTLRFLSSAAASLKMALLINSRHTFFPT